MSSGKVYIGAFRTYPEHHIEAGSSSHEYEAIPLDKIKDFGVHHDRYYELQIEYFKTPYEKELFELLWTRYWKSTLSAAPLLSGSHHFMSRLKDVARKAGLAKANSHRQRISHDTLSTGGSLSELSKVGVDASKLETEYLHGLLQDTMKYHLFCEGEKKE
jgi:COP9 signalosome complex subunit 5